MFDKESYSYHGFEKDEEKARILSNGETTSHTSSSFEFSDSVDVSNKISPSTAKVPSRTRSVLVMFACFFIHLVTFGLTVAYGIIFVELIEVFGSPRAVAALVLSSYFGCSLGCGVLMSRLIMKYDVGICIVIASTIGSLSMASASLSPNIGTVIVLMGIIPGLCASVNILSAYTIVSWFFVDHRRIALSVLTVGASLGQTFIPYVTSALIQRYNWNGTILILSSMFVFNCVPCGLIIYTSKQYYHKPNTSVTKSSQSSLRNILSDRAFMIFLPTLFITILFGPVEQWFAADLAVVKGFGVDSGAILLSVNGIVGLVARIISSVMFKMFPKTRPEIHITYAYALWGIGHAAIVTSPVFWGMALSMVVRGYAVGVLFSCLPSLQLELRGSELFPQTMAITNLVSGVGNVLGGVFGGYVTDITGSYNVIFYIAAGSSVVCLTNMLIIIAILKWRKRSKEYEKL